MVAHEITPHEAVDVHVNYTVYENFLRHLPDAWLAFTEEQLASKNVAIGTTVCVREVDHHYVAREGCHGLVFVTVHTGRSVSFVVTAIVVDSEQTEINARADKACGLGSHIYFKVAGTIVGPRPYVIRNTEPKNKKTKRAAE